MKSKKIDNLDLEKNDIKDEEADKNEKKNDINSTLKSLAGPMKKVCGDAFKIGSEMQGFN